MRLWSLGLTDAEVAAHARATISGNEPGLVGYWPFDEATGATALDRSAGGLAHGSLLGAEWMGLTANLGHPGSKVLRLPDRGGALTCSARRSRPAATGFTFECWARRSGARRGPGPDHRRHGRSSAPGFLSPGSPTPGKILVWFAGTSVTSASDYKDMRTGTTFAATYDQITKTLRIYGDGVKVGEQTATGNITVSGRCSIGKSPTGVYFGGNLAEVRIWDRARTRPRSARTCGAASPAPRRTCSPVIRWTR